MVTVKVKRQQGRIVSYSMSGHAESGPYGHDLVCAGVSAVSFGTVNAVEELCGVQLSVELEEDGGFLRCLVPGIGLEVDRKVQLLLEGMVVSIQSIVSEYGQYIELIEERGEQDVET